MDKIVIVLDFKVLNSTLAHLLLSDSTDAVIEPWNVAFSALAVRRSTDYTARSHPNSPRSYGINMWILFEVIP